MTVPGPLARYHQVLAAVSKHSKGLGLNELVRDTELPRSSAHRIAAALCEVGYLTCDASGTYRLGPTFTELLRYAITADWSTNAFRPALEFLVKELEETAFFARFHNDTVELTATVMPADPGRAYVYPGVGPRPLDTCSSSKAIMAFVDESVVEDMHRRGKLPFADGSIDAYKKVLRKVVREGYAVCDGQIDEGVYSIACPVPAGPMLGLFSIGIVAPRGRRNDRQVDKVVAVLRTGAQIASRQLTNEIHSTGVSAGFERRHP
ncbi:helix-turn-helix domain-containing protein [Polaromonas sp. C04]|uniref:IclR family transcriptional regulator n=1 Tax=Polaromonas sp. C04 TaxID=1945857 RepID=UPI0009C7A104|nr:helix-turn-helix domain-containing protein [Polaromonas sp. C04]OOG51224.1 hypothetical protein B0E49_16390 [Polaromonas sp. C04]